MHSRQLVGFILTIMEIWRSRDVREYVNTNPNDMYSPNPRCYCIHEQYNSGQIQLLLCSMDFLYAPISKDENSCQVEQAISSETSRLPC